MARRGFTILEIVIAIFVLALGIAGIVAIYPTAIRTGKQSVDDSYAASIALSVADALQASMRESFPTGGPSRYVIFNHDGVLDAPPADKKDFSGEAMHQKDYCVLLPIGGNELFYPVPNLTGPGLHPAALLDQRAGGAQVDNGAGQLIYAKDTEGTGHLWIARTYPLGRYRAGEGPTGEVRTEFRFLDINPGVTDAKLVAADRYCSYSYAFLLRRWGPVRVGDTTDPPGSDGLIRARILVFRDFDEEAARQLAPTNASSPVPVGGAGLTIPKTNVPIHEFITMLNPP
ncbi:MAG: prepilin-type N-terminal cleavage/methylation domain-containing protein [Planctomycetota bacterium]|nr:MAG: prepilin-type N-terminal cleavage/methylation domain-containing protein [Planctomycetota bacterium]